MSQPSPEVVRKRKIVGINAETVTNVMSKDFPGHYPGEDHSWNLDHFHDNFSINFHKNGPYHAVFSLVGLDPSIANALRRILLSELPTLAIEDVFVMQNTSIIQDEVLAHRLGLIPLRGSPEALRWMSWRRKADPEVQGDLGDQGTDFNTVQMELHVECTWQEKGKERAKKGEIDPMLLYNNAHIYADQITFHPIGQQERRFGSDPVRPAYPKILLAKMRPGQKIDLTMRAVLGLGSDHAKFSPVATASYRLLPVIDIVRPILGTDAKKFARCFPKGVIGIENVTAAEAKQKGSGYEGQEGEDKAVVKDAMKDTVSRECLRHEEFQGKVKLGRQRDHFIFSIESTGQYESDELMIDAIKVLRRKAARFKKMVGEMRQYG